MYTVNMGGWDSGTIENNTIYGGTIEVSFGPWQISGNTLIGSVSGTICAGAFGVGGYAHDITIEGNILTDPDVTQDGQLERLMTGNGGGYNISIIGNDVSDNVGDLVVGGNTTNSGEMILPESYGAIFEGSTLATQMISLAGTSGRAATVIGIPSSELFNPVGSATGSTGDAQTTLVLYILDSRVAGTAIPVTQAWVEGSTSYFLLASGLPVGSSPVFDFSIAPSYNLFTVTSNMIDTSGTVSTALVLPSNMNKVQVTDNTFKGDQTEAPNGDCSQAIRISPQGSYAGWSSLGTYNSAMVGAGVSLVDMFGIVISGNTIVGPLGGIHIYEAVPSAPTTYGRTYTFVNLTSNTFIYTYQNTGIIHTGDDSPSNSTPGDPYAYSQIVNGTVELDPSAEYFVDPREFSITASGNTVEWLGVSAPATDVQIDAAVVNGVSYDGSSYASPPLLGRSDALQVDLTPFDNAVGITTDDDPAPGNLGQTLNSLSANALAAPGDWSSVEDHVWAGQDFLLGPDGVNDVVQLTGQTIALPTGRFSDLMVLATANGTAGPQVATITVTYTDGTQSRFTRLIGNFLGSGTWEPSASIAAIMPYYNNATLGRVDQFAYLYGYDLQLNPLKTVASLSLNNDPDIDIYALDLVNQPISPSPRPAVGGEFGINLSPRYADRFGYVSSGAALAYVARNAPGASVVDAIPAPQQLDDITYAPVTYHVAAGTQTIAFQGLDARNARPGLSLNRINI
jgi:hypothetical protein